MARCRSTTRRSISRIADFGSASSSRTSACSAARGRLVRSARHPFDEIGLEEGADAHQHAAHRAVAADVVADAARERGLDHRQVDRVENDDGVVLHAQRLGGVDPVAVPAGGAQARVDVLGVLAALRGDDDLAAPERLDVVGVEQRGLVPRVRRRPAALVAGAEEERLDQVEVAFGGHALQQHGSHHAAPTDQSRPFHAVRPVAVSSRILGPAPRPDRRDERARASAWW
jgi:hypothetical protein